MERPELLTPQPLAETYNYFDINNLKDKIELTYKEYKIIIGILRNILIFHCICNKNEHNYQLIQNYDDLIKIIPNFRIHTNMLDIYNVLIKLINSGKYDIKKDKDNELIFIIKLINMFGNEEKYELILNKIEINDEIKNSNMNDKINKLENEIMQLKKEKDEMNIKINNLSNENELIKKELNNLKNKINSLSFKNNNSFSLDSKIFNDITEINFILKEIEKNKEKIKNINLIYRASDDGDTIANFHKKCDDKKNTLLFIETKGGYKFGGYTKVGWKNVKGEDIYDEQAFCFSCNLKKIYNINNPSGAMHCQSYDSRPSFGTNTYVFLLENNFFSKKSKADRITDFIGEKKDCEINGGNTYFLVKQLEVFQISF